MNPVPDLLLSVGSLDIFEIHSTGMEALSTGWYEDIYGEDADLSRIRFLDSALYTVFSGCLFDEFQRVVYADPSLTPEQISQTFVTIARSYGLRSFGKEFSHYWMQVNHNFESPFYYISYAVSMLASLQIYEMAENDWAAAAGFYNDLVSLGAFDYTYCELLDKDRSRMLHRRSARVRFAGGGGYGSALPCLGKRGLNADGGGCPDKKRLSVPTTERPFLWFNQMYPRTSDTASA